MKIPFPCFSGQCRKRVEAEVIEYVTIKNGKTAARGICPECGKKLYKIVKKEEVPSSS